MVSLVCDEPASRYAYGANTVYQFCHCLLLYPVTVIPYHHIHTEELRMNCAQYAALQRAAPAARPRGVLARLQTMMHLHSPQAHRSQHE